MNPLSDGQTYQEYLRSAAWLDRRRRALARARWRCEQCGSWHRIEVHHLTYARVDAERDSHLTALCRLATAAATKKKARNRTTAPPKSGRERRPVMGVKYQYIATCDRCGAESRFDEWRRFGTVLQEEGWVLFWPETVTPVGCSPPSIVSLLVCGNCVTETERAQLAEIGPALQCDDIPF